MNNPPSNVALLITFLAVSGAVWGMIQVHASSAHEQPSPQAVTHDEMNLYLDVLQKEHEMIRLEQRTAFEKIEEQLQK